MVKLLILDVDGTITERDRTILPEVIKAIREVQKGGTQISLVSGNVIPVMYALKIYLGINGAVFGENGGIMLNGSKTEKFFSMDVPLKFYQYLENRISINEILTNKWRETSVAFEGDRHEIAREMELLDRRWKDIIEVVDSRYAWHIMNRGQSKAFAVNMLIEMAEVDPKETLVCGDSDNDFAMYETPARKVAIANSTPSIKDLSEYVSEKSHGFGVIDVFNHYGLL